MSLMGWAVMFLFLAIVAAVLGFGVVASGAAAIAKLIFYVFVAIFVIMLITHLTRRV